MKLIQRKIYKQCLIALAGIAFMVSSMQGIVLCNAEDGHVAVEFVSSVCCGNLNTSISSEESTTSRNKAFSSSKENCGPCVDTPISVVLAKNSKKPNPVNLTLIASTAIVPTTITSFDLSEYQSDSELFVSVNPCLASLRTIILLI